MTKINLQPDEHSDIVGGSTAHRRLNCPRSYALEKLLPRDKGSIYAREGTALHALWAKVLEDDVEPLDLLPYKHEEPARGEEPGWTYLIDELTWAEIGEPALAAFDRFVLKLEEEQGVRAKIMVETRCSFPGIEDAFGTTDVCILCGDVVVVWDWKAGSGPVSAVDNDQLKFYARALWNDHPEWFEGVERVILAIMQPKVNDHEPDIWYTDKAHLERFALQLQDVVKTARAEGENAPIERGDWCKFATCKAICPLWAGRTMLLAEKLAAAKVQTNDGKLTPRVLGDELPDLLELAEIAEDWAKQLRATAHAHLEEGGTIEGWKLVEKRSSGRDWAKTPEELIAWFRNRKFTLDEYMPRQMLSPAQAEKLLKGTGRELPDDLFVKRPSSGSSMAREGSTRPDYATNVGKAQDLLAKLKERGVGNV